MQTSTLPNGITFHALLPTSARENDAAIVEDSQCLDQLRLAQLNSQWYEHHPCLFKLHGDLAYVLNPEHEMLQCGGLSFVRIAEEFSYGGLKKLFPILDFKHFFKLKGMRAVDTITVALILKNAFVCMNGSQVAAYFDLLPPTLHTYTSQGPHAAN